MSNCGCHLDISMKRESYLKSCLPQIVLGAHSCPWGIFLIADWCAMAKSTVCSSFPGQLGVGCVRRTVIECDSRRRLERRVLPLASVPSSYLGFLPWCLLWWTVNCEVNKPLAWQVACGHGVCHNNSANRGNTCSWNLWSSWHLSYFLCEKLLDFHFCSAILIDIMKKESKLGDPAFCRLTERCKAFRILS